MKTILIIACFSILVAAGGKARAQFIEPDVFISTGASVSFIHSSEIKSTFRPGFNTGIGFYYELDDKIDYFFSFEYCQMGAKTEAREYIDGEFIEGPVDCKFYFSNIALIDIISYDIIDPKLKILGGFSLAANSSLVGHGLLRGRYLWYGSSDEINDNIQVGDMYDDNGVNAGLIAGVGTGGDFWQLNLCYTYFFVDMCRNREFNQEAAFSATNSVVELSFLLFLERL